jgi:hypothetical protein
MDKFTRNYSIFLGVVVLLLLVWALYEDPAVSELNDLLKQDQIVSSYPYRFRVLRMQNGAAVISSPRNSMFPMYKALGIIFPRLANRPQNNPDLMQAQQELASVQKRTKRIVMESGKAKSVRWELDRDWLAGHGVILR